MVESIFTLVGVILGFGLTVGWESWKEARKRHDAKRSVRGELELNLAIIPGKRDILLAAREELSHGTLSPTESIHFATSFHDLHLNTIYSDLSDLEAQSLHFIYDHMRIIDSAMDSLLDDLKGDLERKPPDEVAGLYLGLVGDLLSAMDRLGDMLRNHLGGTPVPVIQRTQEYLATKTPNQAMQRTADRPYS